MARNEEKAQAMLNRWIEQKKMMEDGKGMSALAGPISSSYHVGSCSLGRFQNFPYIILQKYPALAKDLLVGFLCKSVCSTSTGVFQVHFLIPLFFCHPSGGPYLAGRAS